MREEDIPQDAGAVYEGLFRRVLYGVREDGTYRGVPSKGWEAEIGATSVSTNRANERIRVAWEQVRAGELAPLGYHMAACLLDPTTLAIEVRTWTWRVRRHLRPAIWSTLSQGWKAAYAEVFGCKVEAIEQLPDKPERLG